MSNTNISKEFSRIERIIKIISMVLDNTKDLTVYDLIDKFGVSRRTILRDIEIIECSGFIFRTKNKRQSNKRVLKFELPVPLELPYNFTNDELTSLYITRHIYNIFEGSHFKSSAESLIKKIEKSFDQERVERLKDVLAFKPGPIRNYKNSNIVIKDITDSIIQRQIIAITYFSFKSNEHSLFRIHPYRLVFFSNALFVLAHSEKHNSIRLFAVERIGTAKSCNVPFDPPQDIDKIVDLRNSFGIYVDQEIKDVVVFVKSEHKKRIKDKILHNSQKLSFKGDGSVHISLKISGKEDFFRWLLSQGEFVRLIEPKEWVDDFKEKINQISSCYKTRSGSHEKLV